MLFRKLKDAFSNVGLFELFLKVKDTNFESNSQLAPCSPLVCPCCFWKSKIQILKAIHNDLDFCEIENIAVSESQRYKFWKQFTTTSCCNRLRKVLFLKVKDTNFESNSQHRIYSFLRDFAVSESQRYKFWKQFTTATTYTPTLIPLFLKVKDTNFESNSQLMNKQINPPFAVSESQRYKFWKQFTTAGNDTSFNAKLFLKVKDTNFESNSQPTRVLLAWKKSCFWKSKIQILKAIHNLLNVGCSGLIAVSESQRYKFWKQFTTQPLFHRS